MKKSAKEKHEDKLHSIPLRITDTTLRDGHQSLWATRMKTDDIMNIIDVVDSVGYYSLEVWGGATFDVCLRFLRENPWERLRLVKSKAQKTPLQMLLRGQNLVGYRNYADDVVDRFVHLACENGVDIFRIFDALNDTRNLESAIKAVKKHGGHAQGTLCYTLSPVHTVDKYIQYAKEQVALGVDSLCIKDMAGILTPIAAERLVSALVQAVKVPIQLHCHASSGMATSTYVEGVRAGAGAIDCAVSPLAGFSSQPPVETLVAIFNETNYRANLDLDALRREAEYFIKLSKERRVGTAAFQMPIDPEILIHQIPGGMISNFRSQLEQQKALDKLPQVLDEVSRVREDLGYPPLVTPTSQIVGTQAVLNILSGERYKMVPNEVKDYVRGFYGRSPAPISPKFIKQILGDEKPIKHRPADTLKPMLPTAAEGVDPKLINNEEDILAYCLLPEPSVEYFKWRNLPQEQRPPTPLDIELKKMMEKAEPKPAVVPPSAPVVPPAPVLHPDDLNGLYNLLHQAKALNFNELSIRKGDVSLTLSVGGSGASVSSIPAVQAVSVPAESVATTVLSEPAVSPVAEQSVDTDNARTIDSPIVGTFYSTTGPGKPKLVKPGDIVNAGDKVCIVEAMKLFNEIVAPVRCKIIKILVEDGQGVDKGQSLITIEEIA
jgi:oxaloacetate decarboxylase (Na+ extruding) subunit alpha